MFACSQGLRAVRMPAMPGKPGDFPRLLRPEQPDFETKYWKEVFGHQRISLRAAAAVAPGIAGVYWAAESHALTFQRG